MSGQARRSRSPKPTCAWVSQYAEPIGDPLDPDLFLEQFAGPRQWSNRRCGSSACLDFPVCRSHVRVWRHRWAWWPFDPAAYVLELRDDTGRVWARVYEDGTWSAWREPGGRPYHGVRADPPSVRGAQRYAERWVDNTWRRRR